MEGYWCYWHGAKGYSGVGLHVRKAFSPERPVFDHPAFDYESRIVTANVQDVTFASIYVPNGGKDFPAKMRFLEALQQYTSDLHAGGQRAVLCGDLNIARAEKEYETLSATPTQYKAFLDQIGKMWETQPNFTKAQLSAIKVPIWIVDADHDEAIKRENTEFMAAQIPGAGLLLQPEVSHFSFLQDPQQFNADILHFMTQVPDAK
jgi:pimeloyl-ACP methyl ester carboxylesterase